MSRRRIKQWRPHMQPLFGCVFYRQSPRKQIRGRTWVQWSDLISAPSATNNVYACIGAYSNVFFEGNMHASYSWTNTGSRTQGHEARAALLATSKAYAGLAFIHCWIGALIRSSMSCEWARSCKLQSTVRLSLQPQDLHRLEIQYSCSAACPPTIGVTNPENHIASAHIGYYEWCVSWASMCHVEISQIL